MVKQGDIHKTVDLHSDLKTNNIFGAITAKCEFCPTRILPYFHELSIPHICNFFTQPKFLENKIYTEKRQLFALNL